MNKENRIKKIGLEIKKDPLRTQADVQDAKAKTALSPDGYDLWKSCALEYQYYSQTESDTYPGCMVIYRSENQSSPPRIIGSLRCCDCDQRIAFQSLCPHQLV